MAAVGHWHAIKRDLLAMQRSADEIDAGTLPFLDLVSIVVASPPGTAVFFAMDGWSKEAQLLANRQEQAAGLIDLQRRHERPGVPLGPPRANQATLIQPQGGVRRTKVEMDTMEIGDWIQARGKNWGLSGAEIEGQMKALRTVGLVEA